jgi:protein-disulfide isomerase
MATKKERREAARRERLQAEANATGAAERRRRLVQMGSAAVLLAVVAIAVLVVVSQSGSGSGGDTTIEGKAAIDKQLRGLDQTGTTLGDPGAKVTVVEFGDLQCPVCAQYSVSVIPALIRDEVRPGVARLEFRNWTIIGPDSVPAAKAALAAADQGRYWSFIELFYRNQGQENSGYVTDDFLQAVATTAGVRDIGKWNTAREDPALDSRISSAEGQAHALGFSGTPSFLVEGPGGRKALGTMPLDQIEAAVDAVK